MGDRTPPGPARLTERDLAAISRRLNEDAYWDAPNWARLDLVDLVADLRAAWAERDELRATLRRINTATVTDEGPLATLWNVQRMVDAALAAPGAGETTEGDPR